MLSSSVKFCRKRTPHAAPAKELRGWSTGGGGGQDEVTILTYPQAAHGSTRRFHPDQEPPTGTVMVACNKVHDHHMTLEHAEDGEKYD
jgi:hypothetical protein